MYNICGIHIYVQTYTKTQKDMQQTDTQAPSEPNTAEVSQDND